MLSRATATAIQAHMVKSFPTLIEQKHLWTWTYEDSEETINENKNNPIIVNEWKRIQKLFTDQGIKIEDIGCTLQAVRLLAPYESYPPAIIDSICSNYIPSKEEFMVIETSSLLPEFIKMLVEVLKALSPPNEANMWNN